MLLKSKKDISTQFFIVSGVLILSGVIFIAIKNYIIYNGTLFSVGYIGLFFLFGLLIFIKGIINMKQQKKINSFQSTSKPLDVATNIIGIILFLFFLFATFILVVLFFFLKHGFGWSLF